ncbi:hypothetical protein [Falsiroseomonas bella]|uniref:hypothetical protein n=1 Tax=Falsiroseomonas bella TaxID=2184016 RepID=UPI0011B6366E|nr:hypothetical protein [Falsiroseomonas bella]
MIVADPAAIWPAGEPDPALLPRRVDRKAAAAILERYYGKVSARTLERWPLAWRHFGGRAVCETRELLTVAEARFNAAPAIRGGRRLDPSQVAA